MIYIYTHSNLQMVNVRFQGSTANSAQARGLKASREELAQLHEAGHRLSLGEGVTTGALEEMERFEWL